MKLPNCIQGSQYSDERGNLNFFNSFDMFEVARFYEIVPSNKHNIRAWQAHEQEKKWFYCNAGSFIVNLVRIVNFKKVSTAKEPKTFFLKEATPQILTVPAGYANGFRALEKDSRLLVFSNFTLEQSKNDDYRFELDVFKADWGKMN